MNSAFGHGQRLLDGFEQFEHTGEGRPESLASVRDPSLEPSLGGWVEFQEEAHDGPLGC